MRGVEGVWSAIRPSVRGGVLVATSLVLVAHSPEQKDNPCEDFGAERVSFSVTGACGEAGELTIVAAAGSCDMRVEEASPGVGLPMAGQRSSSGPLAEGGWELFGRLRESDPEGSGYSCVAALVSEDEQTLFLDCEAYNAEEHPVPSCRAALTPSAPVD